MEKQIFELIHLEKEKLSYLQQELYNQNIKIEKLKKVKKSYILEIEKKRYEVFTDLSNFNDNSMTISNLLSEIQMLSKQINILFRQTTNQEKNILLQELEVEKLKILFKEMKDEELKKIEDNENEEIQDFINLISMANTFK